MQLLKVKDGHTFPYSLAQLKQEFPNKSFPPDLSGVNLAQYGCMLSDVPAPSVAVTAHEVRRVSMYQFLWAVRDYGMREQFERYVLCLDGHARDYWHTAPYVNKGHTCVKHFAEYFCIDRVELDMLFSTAAGIEE